MKFNPTDKTDSIVAQIDFLLFGDSTNFNSKYSLVDRARNVNLEMDEVVVALFKADSNWTWDDIDNSNFPIATGDLVANQDHYSLPDKTLAINMVRIKDKSGNYQTLDAVNRKELNDAELRNKGIPSYYYKLGAAIFPVPVPDYGSTGGIEVQYQRGANHFVGTATDDEPGFASIFHEILPIGAAYRYAFANGMDNKAAMLKQMKDEKMRSIEEHYQSRSKDSNVSIKLKRTSRSVGIL